uniref:Acyl-CoA thioesterase II n=1 Tax=Aureoumbra lagunensis TaxID=44058 RepID=A0A7S3K3M5_9STRA|mmetsp:Transcript_22871/g.27500  ORF Transcript_22871/g.27500 Transcript_22871/m.27500 type:complete len:316 (+) Transcript_22871:135-1082(+)
MQSQLPTKLQRRTAKLVEHLRTVKLDGEDVYRGSSLNLGWGRVYGGQTLAQAMDVCLQSTKDRLVQSLNAYFVKPGNVELPIDYHVTKLSDGKSLSMRTVTASQKGQIIFTMTASLGDDQSSSQQIYHQQSQAPQTITSAPLVPTLQERLEPHSDRMKNYELRRTYVNEGNPFDFRPVHFFPMWLAPKANQLKPQLSTYIAMPALSQVYPQEESLHTAGLHAKLFAYASDFNFLATALRPHPIANWSPKLQMATISHSLIFHRPADTRLDKDFLLYAKSSPIARAGRAFVLGEVFDNQGRLLLSASQEGILRFRR